MRLIWMIVFRLKYGLRNSEFLPLAVGQVVLWLPAIVRLWDVAGEPGFDYQGAQFLAFSQFGAWAIASTAVVGVCASPHAADESDADLTLVPASGRELLFVNAVTGFCIFAIVYTPSVLLLAIGTAEFMMHPATVPLFAGLGTAIGAAVAVVTAVASHGRSRTEAIAAAVRLLVVCAAVAAGLLFGWTRLLTPEDRTLLSDVAALPASAFGSIESSGLLTTAILILTCGVFCGLLAAFIDLYRRANPRYVWR